MSARDDYPRDRHWSLDGMGQHGRMCDEIDRLRADNDALLADVFARVVTAVKDVLVETRRNAA